MRRSALRSPARSIAGCPACLWDRVSLTATLPMGTRLCRRDLYRRCAVERCRDRSPCSDDRWSSAELTVTDADGTWDAAVLSPPGRYLWLRLTFSGDGLLTPEINRIEVNWPRVTSRRFLPASLSPDPDAADFLDRFMLAFDRIRAGYTRKLDVLAGFFDPLATPAADPGTFGPDFLDWLGAWIGVALERNWSVAARRQLVRQAASLFRLRGTPAGLKRHVALYTGVEPKLIEHFRLRRWVTLGTTTLDGGGSLYGPEVVARLQLDVFAQIGQFELMDTGDPVHRSVRRVRASCDAAGAGRRSDRSALSGNDRADRRTRDARARAGHGAAARRGIPDRLRSRAGRGDTAATTRRTGAAGQHHAPRAGASGRRARLPSRSARRCAGSARTQGSGREGGRRVMLHDTRLHARIGCPACEQDTFARNTWFDGKYVTAADLVAEQDYFLSKHRRHDRLLHGWGVVCGLRVRSAPQPRLPTQYVVVEPGSAIDCCGREVRVDQPTLFDFRAAFLAAWQAQHGKNAKPDAAAHRVEIVLRYAECPAEPVPVIFEGCAPSGESCLPNRVVEGFELAVLLDRPPPDPDAGGTSLAWHSTLGADGAMRVVVDAYDAAMPSCSPLNQARRCWWRTSQPARSSARWPMRRSLRLTSLSPPTAQHRVCRAPPKAGGDAGNPRARCGHLAAAAVAHAALAGRWRGACSWPHWPMAAGGVDRRQPGALVWGADVTGPAPPAAADVDRHRRHAGRAGAAASRRRSSTLRHRRPRWTAIRLSDLAWSHCPSEAARHGAIAAAGATARTCWRCWRAHRSSSPKPHPMLQPRPTGSPCSATRRAGSRSRRSRSRSRRAVAGSRPC